MISGSCTYLAMLPGNLLVDVQGYSEGLRCGQSSDVIAYGSGGSAVVLLALGFV